MAHWRSFAPCQASMKARLSRRAIASKWSPPQATARSLPAAVPQGPDLPDGSRQISASGPYYRGPAAPATGPTHHYVFELFALDTMLDVPAVGATPAATRAAVVAAMAGHVRGKGVLLGLYKR